MAFDISFRDFRGFHRQQYVPIKPITLLVGENSAGKTSFLAGIKFALDFLSGTREPSFNGDPYQLGTYDQIAHFRGGRSGRAREFRMSVRQSVEIRKSRVSETTGSFDVELHLTFQSIESHAAVTVVRITNLRQSLEVSISSNGVQTTFINEKNDRFPLDDPSSVPPIAKSQFSRYWPFLLRDFRYRMRRNAENQNELFGAHQDAVSRLSDLAEAITRKSMGIVEATSAIRTRPQRTYTPGTERADGEGSHVPFEIAKLYRSRSRDKAEWEELKNAIELFGAQSSMFKELSVKSFGQTASDPFQIQFSTDGPKTNLFDLGYGTSQVLPILYSIATAKRRGYYLVQQPEVHLHPKAQAALGQYFVDSRRNSKTQFVLETHSDFIVDRVRRAIAEKQIPKEDVSILFFERGRLENNITQIELNEFGDPINPPAAYRSFFIDEQMKVLGL